MSCPLTGGGGGYKQIKLVLLSTLEIKIYKLKLKLRKLRGARPKGQKEILTMANITFINPNMIRVTTSLTKEHIAICKEVAPELLTVTNEEKEVTFRVDTARQGSVSSFGVCFTEVEGNLIATAEFDINKATSKYIAAGINVNLTTVESQVASFIESMNDFTIETI